MARYRMPDIHGPIHVPPLDEFAQPGIYFLLRNSVVVYVGQAVDARRRIGEHLGDRTKPFDAVSFIPCVKNRLNAVERHYIQKLMPEYNRCRFSQLQRCRDVDMPQPSMADVIMPIRQR